MGNAEEVRISFDKKPESYKNDVLNKVISMLEKAQIKTISKNRIHDVLNKSENVITRLADLGELDIEREVFLAVLEIITADNYF